MASPVLVSVVRKALKETLDTVWGDKMRGPLVWEKCGYRVTTTTDNYIDDQEYAGTGTMPIKQQGEIMALDSIAEGYAKRYNMDTFALRMVVAEEALADCKYDEAINGAGRMASSAKWTQEYEGANTFIRAFDANYVGGDSVALCSTAHKLPKGGTYSNMFTTAMSLSETAIEQMRTNLRKMPASNGLLAPLELKKIVIPEDLYFRANRILKSEQQNDSANNAINILKGMGIEIVSNPYFTSTTNWWGVSNAENGLRWVWREKPKFREHNNEDALTATYSGYMRFAYGWTDPRGVYGSSI